MKISLENLSNYYMNEDGTFDLESALNLGGKVAGVCYDKEGYNHLVNEQIEKTNRRIDLTLNNGHHSVYDHIDLHFNIQGLPKILAMIINNEHQYTTSEKSGRYTPIVKDPNGVLSDKEVNLYDKWLEIYKQKIKARYGYVHDDKKIVKLAQENARYMITIFMPTQMIYSTTLRQINYIASWMNEYIKKSNNDDYFQRELAKYMQEFVSELSRLNILVPGLMKNEKHRSLSLISEPGTIESMMVEEFGNTYCTTYEGTYVHLADIIRHRTLYYTMERVSEDKRKYYVPQIIQDDPKLVKEWLEDIKSVKDTIPLGEMVLINEQGTFDKFIEKCKERLCSAVQLEVQTQTKLTLNKYREELIRKNHPLAKKIENYTHGARCTFKDFECKCPCGFKEGINLTREI